MPAFRTLDDVNLSGKRVVVGQRVMQAAGDPFLGWTKGSKKMPQDFYVRQLKDMKGSIDVTLLDKEGLTGYGQVCGAVLARAHARAGDASVITGYLGETEEFDNAVAEFAMAYAAINAAEALGYLHSRTPPIVRSILQCVSIATIRNRQRWQPAPTR